MNEQGLVNECKYYLNCHGFFAWRNNSGVSRATYTNANGVRRDRMWRAGIKGASDIVGICPDGRFIAIECKVGKNKPTEAQTMFLQEITDRGGVAGVVYSLDDLKLIVDPIIKKFL